jgi:lipopolysaccharide transport system permease protein
MHRSLISRMVWREVIGRYRGSILGLGWSFLNPLIMLALYTFVFSVVFQARWGVPGDESRIVFAIVLYVGLICHALLAEGLVRSPNLIQNNANYVKKVVFPLEILVVVVMISALFHALISQVVLLVMFTLIHGLPDWTFILGPLVLLPLLPVSLGLCWFLASLGVYYRDVGQAVGILSLVLLFFSPVFFPMSMLPAPFHPLLMANPLTFIVEQARMVMIMGQLPDWSGLAVYTVVSFLVAWAGFAWFQKSRNGFADVL